MSQMQSATQQFNIPPASLEVRQQWVSWSEFSERLSPASTKMAEFRH
jgi:hypothetical protein